MVGINFLIQHLDVGDKQFDETSLTAHEPMKVHHKKLASKLWQTWMETAVDKNIRKMSVAPDSDSWELEM